MEDVRKTYDFYLEKLEKQRAEVKRTMELLNMMAADIGIDMPFSDIQDSQVGTGRPKIRKDLFVGKPLSTSVEEYLRMCGKEVGAQDWPEIVRALRDGGFELGKTKIAEDQARTTILKNTWTFKLIGENAFGLVEWYPKIANIKFKKQNEPETVESNEQPKRKPGRPPKKKLEEVTTKDEALTVSVDRLREQDQSKK